MIKIMKKVVVASLLAMSMFAVMPVGASAEWKKDSKQNYYWIEKGVKAKGWKLINGNWYNFRNDGVMQVSWVEDNGNWYYLWANGAMAQDCWLNKAGGWYYFDSTGKMVYDSTVVGKRSYDFTQPELILSKDLDNKTTEETTTIKNTVTAENATGVK